MVITLSRQTTKSRRGVRPTTLVVWCYVALIAVGTVLLMLPISAANSHPTGQCAPSPGDMCLPTALSDALFTATSATSLTGLITVDTATHWSTFGKVVIMLLIQLGGLGFMTLASLFGLFVAGRLGLNRRAGARVEGRGMDMGEISWVVRAAVSFTLLVEFVVAVALMLRFHLGYGYGWGELRGRACSMPSQASTMPVLLCIRTTSLGSAVMPGYFCRWPSLLSLVVWVFLFCSRLGDT